MLMQNRCQRHWLIAPLHQMQISSHLAFSLELDYVVFGYMLSQICHLSMLTPNKLVFTFGGSYISANFGENRSRNVTVRVHRTDTQTDRNKPVFSERELASLYVVSHPSVACLSVTFLRPNQPVEIFGNVSTPFCTLAIR